MVSVPSPQSSSSLAGIGVLPRQFRSVRQLPGARDTQFVTLPGSDIHPTLLAVAEDGTLFAGGSFTNYGGAGYAGITRLLSDGRQDPSFAPVILRAVVEARVVTNIGIVTNLTIIPGSTTRGIVTGLALFPNHRVAVVGEFNDVNHQHSTGFVTLYAVVNGSLGLTWPAGFRLQRTASLVSPLWIDLAAATSPWTVPTSASSDFYRIIAP